MNSHQRCSRAARLLQGFARFQRLPLLALVAALLTSLVASGDALDLQNPEPRWIQVQFELSPDTRPGRLDAEYGAPVRAWFQPAGRPGWVLVAIPAEEVERELLASQRPKPDSFGEFVWLFDAATGAVLSAELRGVLIRRLEFGPLARDVEVAVHVHMSTEERGGFRPVRRLFGQPLFEFCTVSTAEGCHRMPAVRLDHRTGYVNAVGPIVAEAPVMTTRSYSSLGEARFREWQGAPPRVVATSEGW